MDLRTRGRQKLLKFCGRPLWMAPIAFFRSLAVERGVKAAVTNSLPLGRMRKKFIGPVRVKSQDYRIALDTNYCH